MLKREDFRIECQYADEDGTEDDMYIVYKTLVGNGLELESNEVDYACEAVATLMNLYLYCSVKDGEEDEDFVVRFDMNDFEVNNKNRPSDLDGRYQFYFDVYDFIKSNVGVEIKLVLDTAISRVSDYDILFTACCLGYKFNYIDKEMSVTE